jgi:hypothetical protein
MDLREEEELKETILDRLFETSSHCDICQKNDCNHISNRTLNDKLDADQVLRAINYDRTFFKDKP